MGRHGHNSEVLGRKLTTSSGRPTTPNRCTNKRRIRRISSRRRRQQTSTTISQPEQNDPQDQLKQRRVLQSATDACVNAFGFAADASLSKYANLNRLLTQNLRTTSFDFKPLYLKVHNLCQDPSSTPPPAVLDALGLDLGFCLSLPREDSNPIDFDRFRRDIRIRYTFRNEEDSDYNRKLYVKNKEWEPNLAPHNIEDAINKFEAASGDAFRQSRHYKHDYNIDPRTIQQLR